jgi:MFS family permease
LSQSVSALSFSFVDTFLPFYIFKVSPYSQQKTLIWVGAILGVVGLFLMIMSPIWGTLTHRFNPKRLFQRAQIANSIVFLLMGFTANLHIMFILKLLQRVFGGVSTVRLILVTSSSSKEKIASNIGIFQACLTIGQLLGPPLGAMAAATFGYRASFVCGSAILFAAALLCEFKVSEVPKLPRHVKSTTRKDAGKLVFAGWIICATAQIQLIFLPSILPKVLETFYIYETHALRLAGVVVMLYTASAAIGTFTLTRLTKKIGIFQLITILLAVSICFQLSLALTKGIIGFTIVRMLQTGFAAAVIPLIFSIFAGLQKGSVIGIMNSARYGGNALGPMLATTTLAVSSLNGLFFIISGLTFLSLIIFKLVFKETRR